MGLPGPVFNNRHCATVAEIQVFVATVIQPAPETGL